MKLKSISLALTLTAAFGIAFAGISCIKESASQKTAEKSVKVDKKRKIALKNGKKLRKQ